MIHYYPHHLLLLVLAWKAAVALVGPGRTIHRRTRTFSRRPDNHRPSTWPLATSAQSSADTQTNPPGVRELEQWLQTDPPATWDSRVKHATFEGGLRGLQWNSPTSNVDANTKVVDLPIAKVLASDYPSETWDSELACQLWDQVVATAKGGDRQAFAGYVHLLTNGDLLSDDPSYCPAPTAPNAVRRWTKTQQELLQTTPAGQKVLALVQQQNDQWRQKYEALPSPKPSWEQFQWGMEVVHSRAFRGASTKTSSISLLSLAAPVVAGVAGFVYSSNNPVPSDVVLIGLAAIGALPVFLNLVSPDKQQSAVLLPLIDSANHLETADSSIDFDPLKKAFQLSVGPRCLDPLTRQLYISYGTNKPDSELLINYGFLPNVPPSNGMSNDEYRSKLAQEFHARNS